MSNCCPICYKVGLERSRSDLESRNGQLQQRFFRLLERFIFGGSDNNGVSQGKDHRMDSTFPLEELTNIGLVSCGECLKLMESFCELFHQLKTVELILNWKLERLGEVMKTAGKVPSRMAYFRDCIERLELGERCWNFGSSVEIAASVIKSRESLIQKCSRTMATSFPRLSIPKIQIAESKLDVMMNSSQAIVNNVGSVEEEKNTPNLIAITKMEALGISDNDDDNGCSVGENIFADQTTTTASNQARPETDGKLNANDEVRFLLSNKLEDSVTFGLQAVTDTCRSGLYDDEEQDAEATAGAHPNDANEQRKFESVTDDELELKAPPVPADASSKPLAFPGSSTVNRSSFRLRTVHPCTKCNKTFSTLSKFDEHQRSHESEDEESSSSLSSSSDSDFSDDDLEVPSVNEISDLDDNDAEHSKTDQANEIKQHKL